MLNFKILLDEYPSNLFYLEEMQIAETEAFINYQLLTIGSWLIFHDT